MLVGDSITDFGTEPYGFCQQLTSKLSDMSLLQASLVVSSCL